MKSTEERFEAVAHKALQEAEAVPCAFAEFVSGLRGIIEELQDRLKMAEDELERNQPAVED